MDSDFRLQIQDFKLQFSNFSFIKCILSLRQIDTDDAIDMVTIGKQNGEVELYVVDDIHVDL